MPADADEVTSARANIDRLYRIARRTILSTTSLVQSIVDEQANGEYAAPSTVSSLERDLSLAGDAFQEVFVAMNTILAWDLLPGDVTAVEGNLQTITGLQRTLADLARKAVKAAPRAPSSTPSTSSTPSFRVQTSLKPKILLEESTPAEFKVWKKAFLAYYDTSHMDQLAVETQRHYINNCLSPQLLLAIEPDADDSLKLFGPSPSVFSVLEEYFKSKHPIFNRRSATLALKQSAGQSRVEFYQSVLRSFTDSEMAKITVDELRVHVVVAGLRDNATKEKIFEKDSLDSPALLKLLHTLDASARKLEPTKICTVAA